MRTKVLSNIFHMTSHIFTTAFIYLLKYIRIKQQVELLKERLKGISFDALYSSDLIRAIQTAEQINTWGLERIK